LCTIDGSGATTRAVKWILDSTATIKSHFERKKRIAVR
jgi:hypothetical protein